jgi:hypothetical protein
VRQKPLSLRFFFGARVYNIISIFRLPKRSKERLTFREVVGKSIADKPAITEKQKKTRKEIHFLHTLLQQHLKWLPNERKKTLMVRVLMMNLEPRRAAAAAVAQRKPKRRFLLAPLTLHLLIDSLSFSNRVTRRKKKAKTEKTQV